MRGSIVKKLIQAALRKIGFELARFTPETSAAARMQRLLAHNSINVVLDVGANTGQYASLLREIGYKGKIISFEPLPNVYDQLVAKSKNDPLWHIAPRTALGNGNGEIVMHVSKNTISSSALRMLNSHYDTLPDSIYIGTEIVKVNTLDSLAPSYLDGNDSIWLKIDVQGYEAAVLEGAKTLLPKITFIQMELSLTPLYEGETLFQDMLVKMQHLGYELYALLPGFTDERTGRLLQVDGIFKHENMSTQ